jgi:protein Tex
VHQDGLVHISQLADRFVKDPREVVRAGQIVQVKVLEVDLPRKRIALTMKRGESPRAAPDRDAGSGSAPAGKRERGPEKRRSEPPPGPRKPAPVYPLAAQLAKLKRPKE